MPIKVVNYCCKICLYEYEGETSGHYLAQACEETPAPTFKWEKGNVLKSIGGFLEATMEITDQYVYPKTHKPGYRVIYRDEYVEKKRILSEARLIDWGYTA